MAKTALQFRHNDRDVAVFVDGSITAQRRIVAANIAEQWKGTILNESKSGGNGSIARALGGNPPILIGDEPTAALDTKTALSVMELLRELATDLGEDVKAEKRGLFGRKK